MKDIFIYVPCSLTDTLVNPHVSVKSLDDNNQSCLYAIIRSIKSASSRYGGRFGGLEHGLPRLEVEVRREVPSSTNEQDKSYLPPSGCIEVPRHGSFRLNSMPQPPWVLSLHPQATFWIPCMALGFSILDFSLLIFQSTRLSPPSPQHNTAVPGVSGHSSCIHGGI